MADVYDRDTIRAVVGGRYLQGRCTAFALALSRRTGWPLVAVRDGEGRLMHAGCRAPGGYADVRGVLREASFSEPWGGPVVPADEATLLAEHPQDDEMVAQADLHAEMLFDLPGTSEARGRFEAFAVALDALCREHGVYLRGPGAGIHEAIHVYATDGGDERGFDVLMYPIGGAQLVRRLR